MGKMVLVVNMDLKMGKGKIGAQCCHAALNVVEKQDISKVYYRNWRNNGGAKICLKGKHDELIDIYKKGKENQIAVSKIHDAGRTQIAAGSLTCVALGPAPSKLLDQITGHLKLL